MFKKRFMTAGALLVLVGIIGTTMPAGASQQATLGQSLKAWQRSYGEHGNKQCGCFGAGVKNGDSGMTWLFNGVEFDGNMADGFTLNLPNHTPATLAEADVLRTMPKDAIAGPITVLKGTSSGSCAIYDVTSATLAKDFAKDPKIGDPQGVLGVELSMYDSNDNLIYNPDNVQSVGVDVAPANPNDAC